MFDEKLLELLVCPESKQSLRLANDDELAQVNTKIRAGDCSTKNGTKLSEEIEGLFMREDGSVGFQIRGNIPVMLIEEAIVIRG